MPLLSPRQHDQPPSRGCLSCPMALLLCLGLMLPLVVPVAPLDFTLQPNCGLTTATLCIGSGCPVPTFLVDVTLSASDPATCMGSISLNYAATITIGATVLNINSVCSSMALPFTCAVTFIGLSAIAFPPLDCTTTVSFVFAGTAVGPNTCLLTSVLAAAVYPCSSGSVNLQIAGR